MSFTKAIESCFNNYFTFRGRAPRSEYNYWLLFQILLGGWNSRSKWLTPGEVRFWGVAIFVAAEFAYLGVLS